MDMRLSVGETISPDFCASSTVIGIDHYTMQSFDDKRVEWDSYTLTSDSPEPYQRWWLVNTPGYGASIVTAAAAVPRTAVFRNDMSGLVTLNSEGNADLSAEVGALAMYLDQSGAYYAEEVFQGAERLVFVGRPYHS
ncbi:MAG TPA: hypothetical protein VHU91_06340 [Mycobacteriales bacterium]|nr:hypothetical protein [Mycobacteriales bacterium]